MKSRMIIAATVGLAAFAAQAEESAQGYTTPAWGAPHHAHHGQNPWRLPAPSPTVFGHVLDETEVSTVQKMFRSMSQMSLPISSRRACTMTCFPPCWCERI